MPPTDFVRVTGRLDAHQSWATFLIAFIHDRHITLFSRVVRPPH